MFFLRTLCTLLFLFIAFLVPAAASAQEVAPGYVHQQWTARDGLPVDGLTDVLQTRDGYLWIATWDGLVRFDGVRFVTSNMGNTAALPSNRITHLFATPDGNLCLLTALPLSIVEHREGRFTRMSAAASAVEWAIQVATANSPLRRRDGSPDANGWTVRGAVVLQGGREVFRASSPHRRAYRGSRGEPLARHLQHRTAPAAAGRREHDRAARPATRAANSQCPRACPRHDLDRLTVG